MLLTIECSSQHSGEESGPIKGDKYFMLFFYEVLRAHITSCGTTDVNDSTEMVCLTR